MVQMAVVPDEISHVNAAWLSRKCSWARESFDGVGMKFHRWCSLVVFIFFCAGPAWLWTSRDPFNVRLILPIPSPPDPGRDWVLKMV